MDHLKLLRELEEKWKKHREVLRSLGMEEEKINEFLDHATLSILAHESEKKLGEQ